MPIQNQGMLSEFVQYKVEGRIGYITLNRPDKRNALNNQVVNELSFAFNLVANDKKAGITVLKATGDVFSAGADLAYLKQLQSNTFDDNLEDSKTLKDLLYQIYTFPKIVIAEVQGHAIAGGCGLATVCDFIFTIPEAKFGYTEVKIGFIPAIVMVFLIRKIGEKNARDLLLTGKLISAQEADRIGLINQIIKSDLLESTVTQFASELVENVSSDSVARIKQMMAKAPDLSLLDALNYATQMNAEMRSTDDCKKGIQAFLDKTTIKW